MGVFKTLKAIGETSDVVLYECRNCGRTLDPAVDACPTCGAAEIAYYEW